MLKYAYVSTIGSVSPSSQFHRLLALIWDLFAAAAMTACQAHPAGIVKTGCASAQPTML